MKVPKDYKNLADFIKRVEQAKYFIASFAKDPTPDRTPYVLRRYESYLSHPIYIERSRNLQPLQQHDNKVYNVCFLSCIYKKDVDSKNKGIDRVGQSKL